MSWEGDIFIEAFPDTGGCAAGLGFTERVSRGFYLSPDYLLFALRESVYVALKLGSAPWWLATSDMASAEVASCIGGAREHRSRRAIGSDRTRLSRLAFRRTLRCRSNQLQKFVREHLECADCSGPVNGRWPTEGFRADDMERVPCLSEDVGFCRTITSWQQSQT